MKTIKLLSLSLILLFICTGQVFAESKRIMVFGDSNTWGWIPIKEIVPASRYPKDVRWPGVMINQLGSDYELIEEGLSARTSASDDPGLVNGAAGLNGLEYLPAALASHMPLDLVVIMLGTNDVKPNLKNSVLDISNNIMRLVSEVQKNNGVVTAYKPAKVLIVSPPPLGKIAEVDWVQAMFPVEAVEKSKQIASVLGPIARAADVPFFDAATVVSSVDGIDGIHMSSASHKAIGKAVAKHVRKILK